MTDAKRIEMLERVLNLIVNHPIDHVLSSETWRLILEDMQQLCHTAMTDKNFDIESYEPDEDWKPIAPVRLTARERQTN
jgi:hypothetical protein